MSSGHNIQQLHVGLLGTRLTGWITKWTGKYGFVRVYSYAQEGRILLTVSQFKDTGVPSAGLRVEFTLDRNERGWRAVNCRRIVGQSGVTAENAATATATDNDLLISASTPEGKFPVLYKPEEISTAQLEIFEQSMRLFRLLGECELPFVPISHRVLIETYMKLMKEFRQDIEDEVFTLHPSSTLRVNWHRIKVIQNLKKTSKNTHSITMQDVRRLDSFQRFLECPTFTMTLIELLSEYTTNISTSIALPAFAKAAWMFIHLRKLMTDHSRDGEEDDMFHSVYLLINWVLLQQGLPFMVDSIFPEIALRREDTTSKAVHDWLLFCLMNTCRDFDKRMKFVLRSSSSEPQDPEKIVNNHRKKMLESGMCFYCSDKSVKCTVIMLCCGSPIHASCLQKWRKSREEEYEGKCLVANCPGCRRGCVEPLIEHQRNNPPIPSRSPRPAAVISSNNTYAALQDNDED